MTQETKKKVLRGLSITGNVLLWAFVIFALLITTVVLIANANSDGVPALFSKSFISIQTNSMEPTYKKGNLVFLDRISYEDAYDLPKDAIITYKCDIDGDGAQDLNTHRIYEVLGNGKYRTKGDNPNAPVDTNPVMAMDIVGTCTEDGKLPLIGGILDFMRGPVGFFIFIVLPLAVFFLYELWHFISLIISERNKAKPVVVDAETEEEIKQRAIAEYLREQGLAPADAGSDEAVPANTAAPNEDADAAEAVAATDRPANDASPADNTEGDTNT